MKHNYNFDCFYNETGLSYYLLGAYMTDGCLERQKDKKPNIATLSSNDLDWLENIRNLVCNTVLIPKSENCYRLKFCSIKLCEFLNSKGCTPAKSLTVKFPIVPEQYLADFIRGCFDGDGSIYETKTNNKTSWETYICSASKDFIIPMNKKLNSLGFKFKLYAYPPGTITGIINGKEIVSKNTMYRTRIRGKNTADFVQWLYNSDTKFFMPRKYYKAMKLLDFYKKIGDPWKV